LAERLAIEGTFVSAVPYGSGHINRTYAATYSTGPRMTRRYIHQRINETVFRDPAALMRNMSRVTRHVRAKLEARDLDDIDRRVLTLVPTIDGADYLVDDDGGYWRTFLFIEDATTYDVVETADQAHEAARAFGEFQRQLSDLGPPELAPTIPGFHDTPERLQAFERAVEADAFNRAAGVADEIRRYESWAPIAGRLQDLQRRGEIPLRVAHNDTKINNVMIDNASGEAVCVIDLDTVMQGLALDDFGDLVRTSTCFAKEDDRDLSKVVVEMPIFEALVQGYLSSAAGFLNQVEIDHLVLAGKLMTFECGLRFLTDYLEGDVYFRIHREGHNLDRARVQRTLVESIDAHEDQMSRAVEQAVGAVS
jgi:aminoglycoside phosphotransferase (APT) family kinase protein